MEAVGVREGDGVGVSRVAVAPSVGDAGGGSVGAIVAAEVRREELERVLASVRNVAVARADWVADASFVTRTAGDVASGVGRDGVW
jgi:hypothetical protein